MSIRIVALTHLALPLVGLLALWGSCKSSGGELGSGTGGNRSGGSSGGGRGGSASGGATGGGGNPSGGITSGQAGDSGGQSGSGGLGRGGSAGGPGGAGGLGGASVGGGGTVAKDAAAGGRGQGGSVAEGGAGGGGQTIDAGPVACNDVTSPGRLAVYYYSSSKVTDSAIQMSFDLVNFTAYTARLQQVTIRYWFTDEDPSSANVVEQYYVPIKTTMKFVVVNPLRTGANTYLEMSFRDAPDAGASWVETRGFNFAFHKTSYAGINDQSNDYSYDPKLTTALGQNPKITAYVDGVLAWGCEPPVQPVVVDAGAAVADDSSVADAAIIEPDAPSTDLDAASGG